MGAPQWAMTTLEKVWEERAGEPPELVWRRSRGRTTSSGHCNHMGTRIVVTAGTAAPRWEQRMVLLHELAHAIRPNDHHGELFWTTAWELYRRFKLPIRAVRQREEAYRKTAKVGYLRTRKP